METITDEELERINLLQVEQQEEIPKDLFFTPY
jgi:hypothetical protein